MKKTYVCLDCQTEFKPSVSVTGIIGMVFGALLTVVGVAGASSGSGGAGAVLLLIGIAFIALGGFSFSGKRCTACGSKRSVPSNTPAGQKILKSAKL